MIRFACHQCHQGFQVDDKAAGKKTKCPKCGAVLSVPAAERAEVPIPSPPLPSLRNAAVSAPPGAEDEGYALAGEATTLCKDDFEKGVDPGLPTAGKGDTQDDTSWAPKPGEAQVEAVCHNCGYSWIFGASKGGKIGLCNNCGESIIIPTLKQAQYAKQKQRQTRKTVIWCCVIGGAFLVFLVIMAAIESSTPSGQALYHAKQYTKNLLNHPDTAALKERQVVKTKPDGSYLIRVVWNAKNSFGVEGTATFYVVVKVKENLDSTVLDVSEGYPPLSW
jgi:predicted RNA-binding Zn-ribbon protein involved in translation (DUF1610 family)